MEPVAAGDNHWGLWVCEQVRLRGPLLFRLAFDVLKDAAKAEDVCQEVAFKALQTRAAIRDPQALKGWLARVVINESLAIRRREKCEQRAHQVIRMRSGARADQPGAGEAREWIDSALEELPQLTQAVVVLRLVQGMSGNEVKDLLGISASEVSRKLHEGMDYLRERLRAIHCDE